MLRPAQVGRAFSIERIRPDADLAPFVRHLWLIDWSLPEGVEHVQSTLPVPAVNLTLGTEDCSVSGVWTHRYDHTLSGAGHVVGVLFKPAGFAAFTRTSLHRLTDCATPAGEVLSMDPEPIRRAISQAADNAQRARVMQSYLRACGPVSSPEIAHIEALFEVVLSEKSVRTTPDLAHRSGVSSRALQRLFRRWVGVGPQVWMRRVRLQEACHRLVHDDVPMAELAQLLGYCDQAHFVRDFTRTIGSSPGRYRSSQRPATR